MGARGTWRSDDDKEKLTTESSASRALSFQERLEDSERLGRGNIYVTRHFEQRVEDGSDVDLSMAEFLARGGVR